MNRNLCHEYRIGNRVGQFTPKLEFCKSEFSSERPLSEGLKNGLTFEIHAKLRQRKMPEVYIVNLYSKTDFIAIKAKKGHFQ